MSKTANITEYLNSRKVELSSEAVELGRLEELKKLMIEANRGAMKAIDLANSAKKPAEDSLQLNKTLLVQFENVKKIVNDLGIDDGDVVKQLQQVKENIKTIDSILEALYRI